MCSLCLGHEPNLVATVRVERNFWTCRFFSGFGGMSAGMIKGDLGQGRFVTRTRRLSDASKIKRAYTAPISNRPHLRDWKYFISTLLRWPCAKSRRQRPSRGVISIPSPGDAGTPLDAAAALPAAARGAGTLRAAAAAVQRERAARERCAPPPPRCSESAAQERAARRDERGAEERCARSGRSPPAPAGTA